MSPMIATVSHPPAGGGGTLPNPCLKLGIHHADTLTSGPKKNLQKAKAAVNITRDLVPIDLTKAMLGMVANILIIAQSVIKNQSDFQARVDKCETIREILDRATKHATDNDLREYLGHALSQLNKSVNRINTEVASNREQGFLQRRWEKYLDRIIPLFSAEMLVGLAIGMNTQTLGLKGNGKLPSPYHPPVPLPRPSMFYGREDLVAELTNLAVDDEHITLIGLGGMGKSSPAKAIINEPPATEKFADGRFFVTYDSLDHSTITFETHDSFCGSPMHRTCWC
ncbi:hypothetical protein C8R48DRAFT_679978 [Suillus tomentosus]|nr:hypothetical protein C8R48DRAFT_679978 [Suillus tomentosus]